MVWCVMLQRILADTDMKAVQGLGTLTGRNLVPWMAQLVNSISTSEQCRVPDAVEAVMSHMLRSAVDKVLCVCSLGCLSQLRVGTIFLCGV